MFLFIYSSTCSQSNGVDLAFLVGAIMAIPICAKQTGANLNPAVTLSMTFKYSGIKLSFFSLLWVYVKAQIIGAVVSMLVAVCINDVYRMPLYP
jgi:glycerol uptake facilitator-like aquaporin